MRMVIALLLLVLSPGLAAASPETRPEYSIQVTGNIEVATDGSVHRYTLDEGLMPKVQELVAANVNRWRFEPILVNGQPVIARTRLRMGLVAVPEGDGYRLKVSNVWFGEPTRTSLMTPPRYPLDAARAGLGARVFLILKLDEAGNVIEAHPEQTSLSAKRSATWRRLFEEASMESARKWKFDVAEIIGGTPQAGSVRVPVDFVIDGSASQWQGYFPGPVTPAPWTDQAGLVVAAKDNLGNGDLQPLGSRFKLKTDVVGAML